MTLYEIDKDISSTMALLEPDETSGLLPDNAAELFQKLQNLGMERQKKLENVAKYVLNIRSEVAAIKEEEQRLAGRRKVLENKDKRLLDYLDYACGGKKTDFGIATLSYRTTDKVEITDTQKAIRYLTEKNHRDCIRTYEPEVSKADVKKLLKSGEAIPGVEIVSGISCSLR